MYVGLPCGVLCWLGVGIQWGRLESVISLIISPTVITQSPSILTDACFYLYMTSVLSNNVCHTPSYFSWILIVHWYLSCSSFTHHLIYDYITCPTSILHRSRMMMSTYNNNIMHFPFMSHVLCLSAFFCDCLRLIIHSFSCTCHTTILMTCFHATIFRPRSDENRQNFSLFGLVYFLIICATQCIFPALLTVYTWTLLSGDIAIFTVFEFAHRMSILPETGIYLQCPVWYYPPLYSILESFID